MDSPNRNYDDNPYQLSEILSWAGIPPPQGLWSEEVQRRCYCFREYLEQHISKNHGVNLRLTAVIQSMTSICKTDWSDDWMAYCGYICSGNGSLPNELREYSNSFEAACRYMVFGDNEWLYVSPATISKSYRHKSEFLKKWLGQQI